MVQGREKFEMKNRKLKNNYFKKECNNVTIKRKIRLVTLQWSRFKKYKI